MFVTPSCVDCRQAAPQTNTAHTLLSASFGWRLSRIKGQEAATAIEWRCPGCWRSHKAAMAKTEGERKGG